MIGIVAVLLIASFGSANRLPFQGSEANSLSQVLVTSDAQQEALAIRNSSEAFLENLHDEPHDELVEHARSSIRALGKATRVKNRKRSALNMDMRPMGKDGYLVGADPFLTNEERNSYPRAFNTIHGAKDLGHREYTYLKFLGDGGFGNVWSVVNGRPSTMDRLARYYSGKAPCSEKQPKEAKCPPPDAAIKVAKKVKSAIAEDPNLDLEEVWNEVDVMQKFRDNPYVVQIYEAFQDSFERYYIVMKFMPGGSLFDLATSSRYYSMADAKNWIAILLRGLASLHSEGVAHHDIKLENVLFGADGRPRYIDFGLAIPADKIMVANTGTEAYAPPEVFARRAHLGSAADVWSLGVVAFILFTGAEGKGGSMPFTEGQARRWSSVLEGQLRAKGRSIPEDVKEVLRGMIHADTKGRKTVPELLGMVETWSPPEVEPEASEGKSAALKEIEGIIATF